MTTAAEDRRRMALVAASLEALETDREPTPAAMAAAVAVADRYRSTLGLPPLDERPAHPEEEFYRRARALGLSKRRG